MNKHSLSSLTVQQLRQCRQTLAKRIDDLKFFNLDLGRTNINLSEEYRELRQRADKVRQGKMTKVRKAKGFRKNIYLQRQASTSERQSSTNQQGSYQSHNQRSTVNRNNFNFNDLYKLGKSKIAGWIGGKVTKKHQEINLPGKQNYQFQYSDQPQLYNQQQQLYQQQYHVGYHQQVIVGDFPPAQVMPFNSNSQPMEQQITKIVIQSPVIQAISIQDGSRDPLQQEVTQIVRQSIHNESQAKHQQNEHRPNDNNEQTHYQRLYHREDNERYIVEEQQKQVYEQKNYNLQTNELHVSKDLQPKGEKKNTSMKNFQFDDLPSIGWKKLKGFIGWGTKNKQSKDKKDKQQSVEDTQRQHSNHQENIVNQYSHPVNSSNPSIQRKRTPIFNSNVNSHLIQGHQSEEDQSMKQQKLQKEPFREESNKMEYVQISNRVEVLNDNNHELQVQKEVNQLEVQSKIQQKQQMNEKEKNPEGI